MPATPEPAKQTKYFFLDAHHRLLLALACGTASYLISRNYITAAESVLVAWICFAIGMIVPAWIIILTSHPRDTRKIAKLEDSSRLLIFLFVVSASLASLLAIVLLLQSGVNGAGNIPGYYKWLAMISVILSWWMAHTVFTFRYAHLYYETIIQNGQIRLAGGLNFPDEPEPDYMDFVYYAFNMGVSFQTSDVSISSRSIRRLTWLHSIIAFAFNTTIIALAITNLAAMI